MAGLSFPAASSQSLLLAEVQWTPPPRSARSWQRSFAAIFLISRTAVVANERAVIVPRTTPQVRPKLSLRRTRFYVSDVADC
jgi:hypothetical protein